MFAASEPENLRQALSTRGGSASQLEQRYGDLDLGLADCAVVVLAARFGSRRILTFDERHFRAVKPLQGGSFELLSQR